MYSLIIIFTAIFIYSGVQVIRYILNAQENKKIAEEISEYITANPIENAEETKEKINIDFNALKKKNPDTVGYLKINGTDIDSIVVQGKDNEYYLSHNFEKNSNKAGWIFADYRNKFDGTDKNIIIYGHNMKNGTMFSSLKKILNSDWQENEENKYITFITENEDAIYEVFSIYKIENEDYYTTTKFSNDKSYQNFINEIKSRSIKKYNVEITANSQVLTISTCGDDSKERIVLHAVKTKK